MNRISEKMKQGITSSIFPGGVLLVEHKKKILLHEAVGFSMLQPKLREMTCDTLFDLASLTKPLVTAAAVACLLQQKLLDLHVPLKKYLAGVSGGDKDEITLFHLLNHHAGLPAWKPYYQSIAAQETEAKGFLGSIEAKKAVFKMAREEPLVAKPGEISCYSDIGFILLGEVLEKISQITLDVFFNRHIRPLSIASESFFLPNPQDTPSTENFAHRPFAATEDSPWRKGVIVGAVHDGNAYAMGGVAGHAGLFSTAFGVYQLVRAWLDSIEGSGFLPSEIAAQFVTRQKGGSVPVPSSWALGWDTPSIPMGAAGPGVSSSGHYFSEKSFGHLGFTGTSIWVDRMNHLVVVFLSNRVHPDCGNEAIRGFRPALHDIIFKEVLGA